MKFALLGESPAALDLARCIASTSEHSIVAGFETPNLADELHRFSPGLVLDEDWESLLHGSVADAVIVSPPAPGGERADQLHKLAQVGLPLIVVHPSCQMIDAFQIQMVQVDTGAPILAYFPGIDHPAVIRLAEWFSDAESLGSARRIEIQRSVESAERNVVAQHFARDALLLRRIVGRIDRIGALDTGLADDWSNLSIHLATNAGLVIRWSARLDPTLSSSQLTVLGETTTAVLRMPSDVGAWTLTRDEVEVPLGNQPPAEYRLLERFERELQGERPLPQWEDACRALEMMDLVEVSCRRGKIIDMHHEEVTEDSTFKSLMAAGGCLALLLVLMMLPVLMTLDSVTRPIRSASPMVTDGGMDDQPIESAGDAGLFRELLAAWPKALLSLLVLFLGLQFLRLLMRRDTTPPHSGQSGSVPTE